MSHAPFVHLHLHSQYSLLDGANRLDDVLTAAKDAGMPAMALTDHGNMFGAIEFYNRARHHGVKPIIGMEAYVAPGDRRDVAGPPWSLWTTKGGCQYCLVGPKTRQGRAREANARG